MKWIKLLILLSVILFCGSASAEFYKYYDENGNVHFTDDFNQVPKDQRDAAKGYVEAEGKPEAVQTPPENTEKAAAPGEADKGAEYEFQKKADELDQRKKELADEYESLMKENERISEMRKSVKNPTDGQKYNESVRALNIKLKDHDKKRKAFFSDVEEYNSKVAEQTKLKQTKTDKNETE